MPNPSKVVVVGSNPIKSALMCWKHIKLDNYIIVGQSSSGKTLKQAMFIIECEDIPEDYKLDEYIKQWATYLDKHKRTPITKFDLRQILNDNNRSSL